MRPHLIALLIIMSAHDSAPAAEDRVAPARQRHGAAVRQRCIDAGVKYPPRELFLRAFKAEREIEVWGGEGALRLIATWPVLAASGEPGPKRREGDRQVPEGCYRVAVFNPLSKFHLSLGLDYPNASDRVRSDPQKPGGDIYIHGRAVSIGCLALGDDAIEELYLLALDTRVKPIAVHIFPARMVGPAWETLRAAHPEHAAFWAELAPIYAGFEKKKRVPAVGFEADGRHRLR
ncbi:MAG: L,D-transpeptidase family protein [Chthoniobacteraceae bacterium]